MSLLDHLAPLLSATMSAPYLAPLLLFSLLVILFEWRKGAKFFHPGNRGREIIRGPWSIPVVGTIWQFKDFVLQDLFLAVDDFYTERIASYEKNPNPSLLDQLILQVLTLTYPGPPNCFSNYCNFYSNSLVHYGGLWKAWLFGHLYVMVCLPSFIEVLLGDFRHVRKSREYEEVGDSPLGGGLITQMQDPVWRSHRKIITPAFHFSTLKSYIPVFHKETQVLLEKIERLHMDRTSGKIEVVNMYPLLQLSNFDMIMSSVFGVTIRAQAQENHPFISALNDSFNIITARLFNPLLHSHLLYRAFGYKRRMNRAKKVCHDFTDTIIRKKRLEYATAAAAKKKVVENTDNPNEAGKRIVCLADEIEQIKQNNARMLERQQLDKDFSLLLDVEYTKTHKSFLELIIEDEENQEKKMTDEAIRDNMITLMFTGQDTTAGTLSVALLMLAIHGDVQDKVLEELDSTFGPPASDPGRQPSYSELMSLAYLDRVFKEVVRLFPAVPLIGREVEQDTPMGPFVLPKGATALISVMAVHRDPRFHERPLDFWPDRFLGPPLATYSYIPFSAGSRNCIGQKYGLLQMKTVLTTILRKYRVSTSPGLKCVEDVDQHLQMSMTLTVRKCPITFTPRV